MDAVNTAIRQEIENGCRTFEDNFARGDARAVAELYTQDGQLLPPASDVITGHDHIAEFWQGAMAAGITTARLDTVEVENCGETVIEVGQYALSGIGSLVVDRGKYVVIWKQEGGRWKLHREIWNSSLPPQQ